MFLRMLRRSFLEGRKRKLLAGTTIALAATLIMTNGDIRDHRTNITTVIIDGKETSHENKHQRLYDRYKARP